jgi:hypothetical protein
MPFTKDAEYAPVTINDLSLTRNRTMKTKISCNIAWPLKCSLDSLWAGVLNDNTVVLAMVDRPSDNQRYCCQETRKSDLHINRLKRLDFDLREQSGRKIY